MHLADIVVIAAYLLALTIVGACVRERQKTTDSYFVAGMSLLAAMIFPVSSRIPSRNTPWDWLAARRRSRIFAIQVGETS